MSFISPYVIKSFKCIKSFLKSWMDFCVNPILTVSPLQLNENFHLWKLNCIEIVAHLGTNNWEWKMENENKSTVNINATTTNQTIIKSLGFWEIICHILELCFVTIVIILKKNNI